MIAAAAALMSLTACTPEQLSSIERTLHIDISPTDEQALLALPNTSVQIGTRTFHPDGTVTTVTAPAGSRCPAFYDEALRAGWPAAAWPRLDAIIWRESNCLPTAHRYSATDDSYGLLQLNMRAHRSWVGPLVGGQFGRLFDPYTNLRVGRLLYEKAQSWWGCGWHPWGMC